MVKFYLLSVLLFLSFSIASQAQTEDSIKAVTPPAPAKYFILLSKPGKVKRIRFYESSKITFRLTGEREKYTGRIFIINKNSFVFRDAQIPLRAIAKITIEKRTPPSNLLRTVGGGIKGIGGLFTLVGGGNYLLTSDKENGRVTFLSGLGLYTIGYCFRVFQQRTYKINKNRTLKTLPQWNVNPIQ